MDENRQRSCAYHVLRYQVPCIQLGQVFAIQMPLGAHVFTAGPRPADGQFSLWARVRVEDESFMTTRSFAVVGTGEPFEAASEARWAPVWVATFHQGPLVWHVFEVFPVLMERGS